MGGAVESIKADKNDDGLMGMMMMMMMRRRRRRTRRRMRSRRRSTHTHEEGFGRSLTGVCLVLLRFIVCSFGGDRRVLKGLDLDWESVLSTWSQ